MKSTVKKHIKYINGGFETIPVEYPDWYDIPDIGFIWNGTQSDAYIEYKGHQFNSIPVEESMWNMYQEENPNGSDAEFNKYMLDNKATVYEMCEQIVVEDMLEDRLLENKKENER